jgi:hypothetical protein
MKRIFKYILIYIIIVLLCVSFLTITSKISKTIIEENIKQSTKDFHTSDEVEQVVKRRDYTFKHPYADAMILNIIYCIDTEHPLSSAMEAKYYSERPEKKEENKKISYDFEKMIENKEVGNTQYLRYWHGYIGIIRILLVFFNLGQIYIFNAIILSVLTIILIVLLIKNKAYALIISFITGLIMCAVNVVPFCLEYTWMFYIMLITSILAVFWKDNIKRLNTLFFITGILTCFFDFLTTEIITIIVPVLIVLILRVKEKKIKSFKQGIIFVIQSMALWGISYICMWITKWILASIILHINAFEYVISNATERINGEIYAVSAKALPWKAIERNLFTLYPLNTQKNIKKLLIIPICIFIFEVIFIRKKDLKKLWLSGLLLLISIIPYVRYAILANHSYLHYFFTFRSQIITVMAITLAIFCSIDIEFWRKKINGINNTNPSAK